MADERLYFTGDDEADRLLAENPAALLIGFALDQQVPVPKAFSGPLELKRRIGTLDPGRIAAMDPAALEEAFRARPALHRFPGSMAKRTQELAAYLEQRYDGDAARLWTEAADGRDLQARLYDLPGFGTMKVQTLLAVLAKRLGVRPDGIDDVLPEHMTLGDVDSPAALAEYQAAKRERKARSAAQRTAQAGREASSSPQGLDTAGREASSSAICERAHLPYRRSRCWYVRSARRKSSSRNAGQ